MKKFIAFLLASVMLFSCVTSFAAYELEYGSAMENPLLTALKKSVSIEDGNDAEETELWTPPKEHPYIYVNDEIIQHIKANKDTEQYAGAYKHLYSLASAALPAQPEGGIMQKAITYQLQARALMHVLGEFDKEHAKETVKYTVSYVKNAKSQDTHNIRIYKDFGLNAIELGSLVYDWCYDVMTASQKSDLAEAIRTHLFASYYPSKPDITAQKWTDLNGGSVGEPLIRTAVAVTALYDVYPEMFEACMPKIQGSMTEAARRYATAGALTDDSPGYSRACWSLYIAMLFKRMGYDIEEKWGNWTPLGYTHLYARLPYGAMIKTGDCTTHLTYLYGSYDTNASMEISEDMAMIQALWEDPYLKYYYQRAYHGGGSIYSLLFLSTGYESKVMDELPLAYEAYDPGSQIIHKTSWQEGLDSPQVTAYMNMHNRRSGDHDHAELGTFQLYYKGPLTISQGFYSGQVWGTDNWANYTTRTISKNGMLIYDANEVYGYGGGTVEANDGGQMMVSSKSKGAVLSELEEHFSEENHRVITEGSYIGPNEQTPAFSYIKGDMTKAYSASKLESYRRSMVFMDTFNETYPGVLITFDRVNATKATYPKTWLLQAVDEPTIEGNKMWFKNSDVEPLCNGKLVNTTLYPENVEITKVGGLHTFISDGKEYPLSNVVGAVKHKSDLFNSGWRCEVKPTVEAEDDIFLNAMFVADADTTAPDLEMKKVEDDLLMGVVTLDRQVMFAKDAAFIDKEFTVKVEDNNGGGEMLVLLTDVQVGKWKVTGNGVDLVVESKESDGAFAVSLKPGTYTVSPVEAETEVTDLVWAEAEKEKIGDFSVRLGSVYQYMRDETKLKDGVPYIPESFAKYSLGATTKREGNTLTVTTEDGKVSVFTAGSNTYQTTTNGVKTEKTIAYAPFIDEKGVFYLNPETSVASALGMSATYYPKGLVLVCNLSIKASADNSLSGVDESKVIWPESISASTDDGNVPENLIDRNLDTRWSSQQGDGEWACFYMGEEPVSMSAVQIAWLNGHIRHWKFDIEVSDDGENFTKVLEGMKSGGETKEVETFELPAGVKARYIRYVGHGEEVTNSFFNSVTEFIILK